MITEHDINTNTEELKQELRTIILNELDAYEGYQYNFAKICQCSNSRMSNIKKNKLEDFSTEMLSNIVGRLGYKVKVQITK